VCALLGIATTLREAYSVLNAKALIVARPKVGTRVRPKADWNMLDPDVLAWHLQTVPTKDFIDDLYTLRQMIEPAAAALAATAKEGATINRIAAAYADMERFKDGGGDLIAADLQFHLAILEATGNYFIGALGGLIHAALLGAFTAGKARRMQMTAPASGGTECDSRRRTRTSARPYEHALARFDRGCT
jgi:DNA-binding FadR family transcriptional regulator